MEHTKAIDTAVKYIEETSRNNPWLFMLVSIEELESDNDFDVTLSYAIGGEMIGRDTKKVMIRDSKVKGAIYQPN